MRIASLVLTIAIMLGSHSAYADFINPSFQSGDFSGWRVVGAAYVVPSQDHAHSENTALLYNHDIGSAKGVPVDQLESFLGMVSGTLSGVSNEDVVQGSAIQQTIYAHAGDTISFQWNFLTNENVDDFGVDDFSFVQIENSDPEMLADVYDAFSGGTAIFDYQTGTHKFSRLIVHDGYYTVTAGVVDVLDNGTSSALRVSNFSVVSRASAIPEPTSLMLLGTSLAAVGGYYFRFSQG